MTKEGIRGVEAARAWKKKHKNENLRQKGQLVRQQPTVTPVEREQAPSRERWQVLFFNRPFEST